MREPCSIGAYSYNGTTGLIRRRLTLHSDQFLLMLLRLFHPMRQQILHAPRASRLITLAIPTATATTRTCLATLVTVRVAHSTLTAIATVFAILLAATTVAASAALALGLVVTRRAFLALILR